MTLSGFSVELLARWCAGSEELADIRAKARSDFFGYDDLRPIKYWEGAEELNGRERRFLGWFVFYFRLENGKHPAEVAAAALLKGAELTSGLKSIQGARYVTAVVTMVAPGKGIFLEVENEEFEVMSSYLSRQFNREDVICAHLLTIGRNRWAAGPGWLTWPTRFGPGIRAHLKQFQSDPIEVERFLQGRSSENDQHKLDIPQDKTLEEAVMRMTEAARSEGKSQLVLSLEEWKSKVLALMKGNGFNTFYQDIVKGVGKYSSLDDLNKWMGLASNIWNNVPQPDRGNKSAVEIIEEYKQRTKDRPV